MSRKAKVQTHHRQLKKQANKLKEAKCENCGTSQSIYTRRAITYIYWAPILFKPILYV